jgi:hypothetical protein
MHNASRPTRIEGIEGTMTADEGWRSEVVIMGAVGAVALILAAKVVPARRPSRGLVRRLDRTDRRNTLAAYLREHLTGSDAATRVVARLRRTHEGTREGTLFRRLHEEFQEEREIVRGLLADQGFSPRSIKRLAGQLGGLLFQSAGDGLRGDPALFRTLEALAIGVQGKRCLWRTLQTLGHELSRFEPQRFTRLESRAAAQWEAIEECRRRLVPLTLAPAGKQH